MPTKVKILYLKFLLILFFTLFLSACKDSFNSEIGRYRIVSCGKATILAEINKGYGTCMLDTVTGNFYGTPGALDLPDPHRRWFLIADIEGT